MNEMIWLVAIAVGLAAVGAAVYVAQKQRSRQLRTHFGPEYDHALEGFGERRAAERALLDRARRVEKLSLRPLPAARRDELWARWQGVQAQFVDDPAGAIHDAHALLVMVMRERGYPAGKFDEEVELLSVHHPSAVQHYREAHRLADERAQGHIETERLRQALIHYRALFEDLLAADPRDTRDTRDPRDPRREARHEA